MKKKTTKKLELSKETLKNLDETASLGKVVGGDTDGSYTGCDVCYAVQTRYD